MVKRVFLICFVFSSFSFLGQEEFKKEGVLRASATFAIGKNLSSKQTNLMLPGFLEYYIDETVSVRSDAVLFLGHGDDSYLGFTQNHNLFTGASYHFTKNKQFDPYVGLQAGMALTQFGIVGDETLIDVNVNSSEALWLHSNKKTSTTLNPLISPNLGVNYYASRYFHMFLGLRYIHGKHYSEIASKSLEEIRFEFGLGFNIQTKK